MKPNKRNKKNKNYLLLKIPDSAAEKTKQYHVNHHVALLLRSVVVLCILAVAGYIGYSEMQRSSHAAFVSSLNQKITQLTEANTQLTEEKDQLNEKVTILSDTVNQKVIAEEELAEKSVPSGFPLSATASIVETVDNPDVLALVLNSAANTDDNTNEDEPAVDLDALVAQAHADGSNPLVLFQASAGTSIVAAGNGIVLSVETDTVFGNCVKLDHGNGYISIYRTKATAKVQAGDEVTGGTMLFEMEEGANQLGYQITKEGTYINPMDILEIYG